MFPVIYECITLHVSGFCCDGNRAGLPMSNVLAAKQKQKQKQTNKNLYSGRQCMHIHHLAVAQQGFLSPEARGEIGTPFPDLFLEKVDSKQICDFKKVIRIFKIKFFCSFSYIFLFFFF